MAGRARKGPVTDPETFKRETKAARVAAKTQQLHEASVLVPVGELKAHPSNPNIGNVDEIAASLSRFGQYRPIVCNRRNGFIVAGHHTWLGARQLGWDEVSVVWIDVDEPTHLAIMVADNRLSDLRQTDERLLDQILQQIKSFEGTGYTALDVEDLHTRMTEQLASARIGVDDVLDNMPAMTNPLAGPKRSAREEFMEEADEEHDQAARARGVSKPAPPEEDDLDSLDEMEEMDTKEVELQAVLEVKEENFEFWKQSTDEFGIPELRDDMLLQRIPEPLMCWGGNDATPDDGKHWFIYNYSLGGIKGLPFDRSILSFFTHDEKFDGWWETPAWYTTRILVKGCRTAIAPDFSMYESTPRVVHLWNVYRSMWLARYFQEAGMQVVPRLQFDYMDPTLSSLEIGLRGIPRGCPVLATSQQNVVEAADEPRIAKYMRAALDEIKPQSLIFYSGPGGRRAMESLNWKGKVVYVENYVGVRRGVAFGKKEGMQGLSTKQREKALKAARARLGASSSEVEYDDTDDDV